MSLANEDELEEENERPSRRGGRQPRPLLARTLFIQVDDLDLDTPEGQDIMLKRMQILLATQSHNALDLNSFKILKDSVKVKTDLQTLMMFQKLRAEFDAFKTKIDSST